MGLLENPTDPEKGRSFEAVQADLIKGQRIRFAAYY